MDDGNDSCRWLRSDVDIQVHWRDATPHGGPIGTRLEHTVRSIFAPVVDAVAGGSDPTGPEVRSLLATGVASDGFGALARPDGSAWRLHDDVVHPDPRAVLPDRLRVVHADGNVLDVGLTPQHWGPLHATMAALAGPGIDPTGHPELDADIAALVRALADHGFLTDEPTGGARRIDRPRPGTTLVGHACVAVHGERATVLVDPFLRARSTRWPATYQPMTLAELGPVDAVLLTHGHPDHFDPGTLLRVDPDVPVIVPEVPRESILSADLARRLRQLGFTDIRPRPWHAVERIGDLDVHVLPFLGEQPCTGDVLHPEVTVAGNTYVVVAPWGSVATVADGGRDRRGELVHAAAAAREDLGPVDIVFSGYRGWVTSPAELLRSSVARYALFVPPGRWGARDELMNDPAGAVATAEAFGARVLVPYADGGAPWYWEIGLGPRLDEDPFERDGFDLYPERVVAAAAQAGATGLDVRVLRPGEHLALPAGGGVCVQAGPDHVWPWASPSVGKDASA